MAGACELSSCQLGPIGSPSFGYGDFGPMSATVGTTTVPLRYDRDSYPTVAFPASVMLGEGGIMKFHGGRSPDVPTFDVAATIPGLAVITSPVPAANGGAPIIDTSHDLSVTWAPISIGQITFRLSVMDSPIGLRELSVECTFDGVPGTGVVPQTILSSLKEMAGTSSTYASISSELQATTVAHGLTIVTMSDQESPTAGKYFEVALQ